ncbi:MAG: GNAT family N-acetyltransferase [Lachnospiraceae bacterium]|nr:GNAT family N-acetyltransferase [Lachnospiraceae bacterium]
MVELKEITKDNYEECLNLSVADNQRNFVSSNVHSLAQAWVYYNTAFPFAIYADNIMVGFIMLGYYEAQNYYTIWKLMIDTHYQNKGYGKIALKLGIDYLVNHFNVKEIYTAYEMNNSVAKKFYRSFGFRETGVVVGNDVGMKLIVKGMSDNIPDYL